jgi:hypothetical protein
MRFRMPIVVWKGNRSHDTGCIVLRHVLSMEVEATIDVGCLVPQNTRVLSMSFDCKSLVIAQSTGSQSDLALNNKACPVGEWGTRSLNA